MKIGNIELETPVILAPMAGVTDKAFRILCREMGAGLVCTEMISAKAVVYKNKKTALLGQTSQKERPVSLQLFGSDPAVMAEAAAMIDDWDFDILDVNMGCPVPKVVKNGEGSALMLDPPRAGAIVKALVNASSRPVTVKFRSGFDKDHLNAAEFARVLEANGASAVAVHGRPREQYYSGKADWNVIKEVKDAVNIPVAGNGDIKTGADALAMFDRTGCDAVMIARSARGNPWIFRQIRAALDAREKGEDISDILKSPAVKPGIEEICQVILRQTRMSIEYKGEYIALREMRKHTAWYTAGCRCSSSLRRAVNQISTYKELEDLLAQMVDRKE